MDGHFLHLTRSDLWRPLIYPIKIMVPKPSSLRRYLSTAMFWVPLWNYSWHCKNMDIRARPRGAVHISTGIQQLFQPDSDTLEECASSWIYSIHALAHTTTTTARWMGIIRSRIFSRSTATARKKMAPIDSDGLRRKSFAKLKRTAVATKYLRMVFICALKH